MGIEYIQLLDASLEEKIKRQVGDADGTYKLHLFQGNRPKRIDRIFGKDDYGVLYIGQTTSTLLNRVRSLRRAITNNFELNQKEPKLTGHKALSQKYYRIRNHINVDDLFISLCETVKSSTRDESLLLEEYVKDFGELPPFNGNYGSEVHWELFLKF